MQFISNYFFALTWSIIIISLMAAPPSELPSTPIFVGFDKLAHCGSFYLLTICVLHGYNKQKKGLAKKWAAVLVVGIIGISLAFLTEGIQLYSSMGRSADWWDIFADILGVSMALFSYLVFYSSGRKAALG